MNSILKIYTRVILFLFPFFFLPVIYNSFSLGKTSFLLISGFLGLLIWFLEAVITKKEVIKWNKFLVWFLLLIVWLVVSFIMTDPGVRMKSMMTQFGLGSVGGIFIWLFLWLQISDREESKKQFLWLSASGVVVAVTSLISFMIPVAKLPLVWPKSNPLFSISEGWSITGSILGEIILFLLLMVEWLRRLLNKLKDKADINKYLMEAVGVIFFGLLLFLDIYKMTKIGWIFLDNKTAWVIAVESLKNNPIFGVGPGNFYQAFLNFKPVSFNLTKLWSSGFDVSSMGILNIWTELGLGGLLLVVIIVINLLKKIKEKGFGMVLLMSLIVLFSPINLLSLFLLVWVVAFSKLSVVKESKMKLMVGEKGINIMPYIWGLVILGMVGFGGYWEAKILIADGYWRKAILAASKNDGTVTYNLEVKAIGINPNMADYRAIYSQTNLALAKNFLVKENMTDEDKQNGTTLVQQAVREAKAAVSLDQKNADYWSNLANIYKSLVGMVDGATDWSAQAYQQAIIFDPVDPLVKLDLGGLYYGMGDFESADRIFEQVVSNKKDYANGWYNWAYSAKELNKLEAAVNRMDQVLKLIPTDSTDYEKATEELNTWKKELEELNKKQAEAQKTQETKTDQVEALTTPEPLPTSVEENQILLPTGSEMAPTTPEPTAGQ